MVLYLSKHSVITNRQIHNMVEILVLKIMLHRASTPHADHHRVNRAVPILPAIFLKKKQRAKFWINR